MNNYDSEKKARNEYSDCRLHYKLQSDVDTAFSSTGKNYEKMRAALEAVGVWLDVDGDDLYLSIYPERYIRVKDRNAGRRQKLVWNKDEYEKGIYESYKYADIVFMMQTMKDQEVADTIGMPIATYYRHKKSLRESAYFKSLDLNRLRDKEYLDGVEGNYCF